MNLIRLDTITCLCLIALSSGDLEVAPDFNEKQCNYKWRNSFKSSTNAGVTPESSLERYD